MLASYFAYLGFIIVLTGLLLAIRPSERQWVPTRRRAFTIAGAGLLLALLALGFPVSESSPATLRTRLDEFVPVWQFSERHTLRINAPPGRVYDALLKVKANEISLFNSLTWIRRAGREQPENILNADGNTPVVDAAVKGGFARLADDAPRELVLGTVVIAPPGVEGEVTPDMFRRRLPPGFAVAAMNFLVTPIGDDASLLSTETRVYANNTSARQRFAAYWRMILPGSAFIRRSWLRAVAKRATKPEIH